MDINISDRTVEWHVERTMRKLGANNRIQAVVLALRDGLITVGIIAVAAFGVIGQAAIAVISPVLSI
jgi:hypothetical protein